MGHWIRQHRGFLVFMMLLGDNRDNSADSRYIGLVPRQLLIGKAVRVLVSVDILGICLPRLERFGQALV